MKIIETKKNVWGLDATTSEMRRLRDFLNIAWFVVKDRHAESDPTWQSTHDAELAAIEEWLNLVHKVPASDKTK